MAVAAKEEMNNALVPSSIPTDSAMAVNTGAVAEPHHSKEAVMVKPIMIFFNKLPRVRATTIATRNGTTAKSANGNTRFPGRTRAIAIVKGMMINAVVMTS